MMIKAKLVQTELRLWELGYNLLVCDMDANESKPIIEDLERLRDTLTDFITLVEGQQEGN